MVKMGQVKFCEFPSLNKIVGKYSSDYKGVSKRKPESKYFNAIINLNGKRHSMSFVLEEHAARYRDLYIMKHVENPTFKFNFRWNDKEEIEKWKKIFYL